MTFLPEDLIIVIGDCTPAPNSNNSDKLVLSIVETKIPNYLPAGFTERQRIDEFMFTAESTLEDFHKAESDPNVEAIDKSRTLRTQ